MIKSKIQSLLSPGLLLQAVFLISALVLSADVWLQAFNKSSICTTSSCQVVGNYVRFGELALVKVGAVFFWALWILTFFACRYSKDWLWGLLTLILFGALAFDGGLLGFQFVILQEHCQICIGVGLALFAALAAYSWLKKMLAIFLLGACVWLGGMTANSILIWDNSQALAQEIPELDQTAFLRWPASEDNSTSIPNYHLFFSLHCGHCSEVLANLGINLDSALGAGDWFFHIMDSKNQDLQKIRMIQTSNASLNNPFISILQVEQLNTSNSTLNIPDNLHQTVQDAQKVFTARHYPGVPLLIANESFSRKTEIVGSRGIINYFKEKGIITRILVLNEGNGTNP